MPYQEDPEFSPEYLEAHLKVVLSNARDALLAGDHEAARELCAELVHQDAPIEYRMDGLHQLGLIELEMGEFDEAFEYFEHARRLAIDLNNLERAGSNQRKLAIIAEKHHRNPEKATSWFRLAEEYQIDANSGVQPDPRFSRRLRDN